MIDYEAAYEALQIAFVRKCVSNDRLIAAAKELIDTIPVPPTDDGRRVFDALLLAIWDATP